MVEGQRRLGKQGRPVKTRKEQRGGLTSPRILDDVGWSLRGTEEGVESGQPCSEEKEHGLRDRRCRGDQSGSCRFRLYLAVSVEPEC